MALSCSMALTSGTVLADASTNFTITITNTNAAAVTLQSIQISESTESDAMIGQPNFLVPNVPVGVGNPVIAAGASVTYSFSAIFNTPYFPGPSPQNQPGGARPGNDATEVDPFFVLQAICQTSDGSVFSSTIFVPVLSAISPFVVAEGGALQFSQGANLMNLTMLGAL